MTALPPPGSSTHATEVAASGAGPAQADRAGGERVAMTATPPARLQYALVRAMEDVMAKRHEQIVKFGHTPEADLARPLRAFAFDIEAEARAVIEDVQFGKPPDRIRRRLVKLAALALATIDRIDNEGSPS